MSLFIILHISSHIYLERERDRLLLGFVSSSYCGISSCRSKSFQPMMKTARQLSASFGHGYNGWLCAVCSKWPESTVVIIFGSAVQRTNKKKKAPLFTSDSSCLCIVWTCCSLFACSCSEQPHCGTMMVKVSTQVKLLQSGAVKLCVWFGLFHYQKHLMWCYSNN